MTDAPDGSAISWIDDLRRAVRAKILAPNPGSRIDILMDDLESLAVARAEACKQYEAEKRHD